MGLDMYLYERKYVGSYDHSSVEDTIKAKAITDLLDLAPVKNGGIYVMASVGYWRKANQIHAWFVREVQNDVDDCGEYYLEFDRLAELRDICQQVLDDRSLAEELLPSQAGFFFGSTEYADWYFQDLEYTIALINKIEAHIESTGQEWAEFIYSSSW